MRPVIETAATATITIRCWAIAAPPTWMTRFPTGVTRDRGVDPCQSAISPRMTIAMARVAMTTTSTGLPRRGARTTLSITAPTTTMSASATT